MKRRVSGGLCVLLVALVYAATASGEACETYPPPNEQGIGTPQNIDFGVDNTVTEVLVSVHQGYLREWVAEQVALDITITSVDGVAHFHGSDVVLLSETTVFDASTEIWDVVVPWTQDDEEMVVNDLYTVCAQLVVGATSVAPQVCSDFGPF